MKKDKEKAYAPHMRSFYKPEEHDLISQSPNGVSTKLPSPVEDDIVCQNIAYQEFDYTENPLSDDEDQE